MFNTDSKTSNNDLPCVPAAEPIKFYGGSLTVSAVMEWDKRATKLKQYF